MKDSLIALSVLQTFMSRDRLAYALLDADLKLARISPNLKGLLHNPGIYLGQPVTEVFEALIGAESILEEVMIGRLPEYRLEYINYVYEDFIVYITLNLWLFEPEPGMSGFLLVVEDVTSVAQTEQRLIQARNELHLLRIELERDISARKQTEKNLQVAQERLQKEIDVAVEIQNSMTPKWLPELDGFEFAARSIPARYLSGDFYDFISIDEKTCEIVLGDIAGKGIPAALLTLSLRTLIRDESTPFPFVVTVPEILNEVNVEKYAEFSQMELFVTLFLAQIHQETGRFSYASAGHGEALLWRSANQQLQHLPATGLPIGISVDEHYDSETFLLRPGDLVIVFSDGITEAINKSEEQFGLERLQTVILENATLSATEMVSKIEAAVLEFSQGREQEDDISVIILKTLPRTIPFSFPGTLEQLGEILVRIREHALAYSEEFAYEFELASSEIVTNIIKFARTPEEQDLLLDIILRQDGLQVDIFDQGQPFDLAEVPAPDFDHLHESGYGLSIASQLLDELVCQPSSLGGNHWKLIKFFIKESNDGATTCFLNPI